jgi:hypothetical protein
MRLQDVFVPNVLEIFIYETRGESPVDGVFQAILAVILLLGLTVG